MENVLSEDEIRVICGTYVDQARRSFASFRHLMSMFSVAIFLL